MREKLRDEARLLHMQEAIENIRRFIEGKAYEDFTPKSLLYFGVIKNLEIIGEAAYKLSKEFIEAHPDSPWRQIISMRHYLVHGYYQISVSETWNTINDDLPVLKERISSYLKELNEA